MEIDGRESFGRYFEDFNTGDAYKHWPGKTITEFDDTLFCLLTMNHNPLHLDENYMKGSQFGRRLVVGTYVFSLVVGMSVRDISGKAIANLGYDEVRHVGPSFYGDTIYAETKVLDKKESKSRPDRGIVIVETRAWNQKGETVLTFKRQVLVPKKKVS